VTGTDCHWNVFASATPRAWRPLRLARRCSASTARSWYFITPDYAFGHTLHSGFQAALKAAGGTELGESLTPLGSTDYSSYLISGAGHET